MDYIFTVEFIKNILSLFVWLVLLNIIIKVIYKYSCYNLLITISNNKFQTDNGRGFTALPGTKTETVTYYEFVKKNIPKFYVYTTSNYFNIVHSNIGCGIMILNKFICIYDIIYIPKTFKDYLKILGYINNTLCSSLDKKHPEKEINNEFLESYFHDLTYKNNSDDQPVIKNIFTFEGPYNVNDEDIEPAIYYDSKSKSINIIGLICTIESLSYIKTIIEESIKNTKSGDKIICIDENYAACILKNQWINMGMNSIEYNKIICVISENLIYKPYDKISSIIFFDTEDLLNYNKSISGILTNKSLRKYTANSYISY